VAVDNYGKTVDKWIPAGDKLPYLKYKKYTHQKQQW
jgi:hypothetical protein